MGEALRTAWKPCRGDNGCFVRKRCMADAASHQVHVTLWMMAKKERIKVENTTQPAGNLD